MIPAKKTRTGFYKAFPEKQKRRAAHGGRTSFEKSTDN